MPDKEKLMTPAQVWEGFSPEGATEFIQEEETTVEGVTRRVYTFTAVTAPDGDVQVGCMVFSGEKNKGRVMIISEEYSRPLQTELINDLIADGYSVIVPDLTGKTQGTVYPESLSYGYIEKAGEHINKVCPSARETNQYLYSLILKRTVTFSRELFGKADIVMAGIGEGVETAVQAAAFDTRISFLVCLNGAGYKEYIGYNKFDTEKEMPIDHALMCWLTGVSAAAYLKFVEVPVFFAVSSNSIHSDIDRTENLLSLVKDSRMRIAISAGGQNSINAKCYQTAKKWLEYGFSGEEIPEIPEVNTTVSEGILYAEIKADAVLPIREATVYFAFGEHTHTLRNWREVKAQISGEGEFLAKIPVADPEAPLFYFCEVAYEDDFWLSSVENYFELDGENALKTEDRNQRIIFDGSFGAKGFTEDGAAIQLTEGVRIVKTPIGLKGISSERGELVTYEIGEIDIITDDKILTLDVYSDNDAAVKVTLFTAAGTAYCAESYLPASSGAYTSLYFSPIDFKSAEYKPLQNWQDIRAVKIHNPGLIIGKILFI